MWESSGGVWLGLGRVVDAGRFEGEKGDRRDGFESYGLFGWFKDERHSDDNVRATTETSVAGIGALAAWYAGNLAARRGKQFAGNQLQARKQEDNYGGDPKDCYSRGHCLLLIFSQVSL
jgi:hypothetical protein